MRALSQRLKYSANWLASHASPFIQELYSATCQHGSITVSVSRFVNETAVSIFFNWLE
jgi:hypothetical protein